MYANEFVYIHVCKTGDHLKSYKAINFEFTEILRKNWQDYVFTIALKRNRKW